MFGLPDCISDQGQAIKDFSRISWVMYLVYKSNARSECQAKVEDEP